MVQITTDIATATTVVHPTPRRETFTKSRAAEYMSEAELTKQIGFARRLWPDAIVRELVDNSLDHCEETGRLPEIEINVSENSISVADNGMGIPDSTIEGMLDFNVRVSSREAYRGPTRGAQGNAGKTVFAAPFVLNRDHGRTEILVGNTRHEVTVSFDELAQMPIVSHSKTLLEKVHLGTLVRVHIDDLASKDDGLIDRFVLLRLKYATLNPHLSLRLSLPDGRTIMRDRQADKIRKWTPAIAEPACWYDQESFSRLVGACISSDREAGTDRNVRQFVAQFAGLKRTETLKAVLEESGLHRSRLSSLVNGECLDAAKIEMLLSTMRKHGSVPPPTKLGVIGRRNLERSLGGQIKYRRVTGESNGLPFVVETAFIEREALGRVIISGCNFSPSIHQPCVRMLDWLLEQQMVDEDANAAVFLHIATIAPDFLDRGKSVLEPPAKIEEAIEACVKSVTSDYCRRRRAEERDANRTAKRQPMPKVKGGMSLKEAVRAVIPQAAAKAAGVTDTGESVTSCPFSDRDFYYAARELIQTHQVTKELTQSYFDRIVDEYEIEHGIIEGRERDPRGYALEPHSGQRIPLGTRSVEQYEFPDYEYQAILFFEKKGVVQKLQWRQLHQRYDCLVLACEGYAPKAAKALIQAAQKGRSMKVLCFHDADPDGLNIARTLSQSTGAHEFEIKVIDCGLRLQEALDMGLQTETFTRRKQLPRKLRLTPVELEYFGGTEKEELKGGKKRKVWVNCRRIELNALTCDPQRFVDWVEGKIRQNGIKKKLVPPKRKIKKTARSMLDDELKGRIEDTINSQLDIDEKITEISKKVLPRVDMDDPVVTLREWSRGLKPESWSDCLERDIVNSAVNRIEDDILDEVQANLMKYREGGSP